MLTGRPSHHTKTVNPTLDLSHHSAMDSTEEQRAVLDLQHDEPVRTQSKSLLSYLLDATAQDNAVLSQKPAALDSMDKAEIFVPEACTEAEQESAAFQKVCSAEMLERESSDPCDSLAPLEPTLGILQQQEPLALKCSDIVEMLDSEDRVAFEWLCNMDGFEQEPAVSGWDDRMRYEQVGVMEATTQEYVAELEKQRAFLEQECVGLEQRYAFLEKKCAFYAFLEQRYVELAKKHALSGQQCAFSNEKYKKLLHLGMKMVYEGEGQLQNFKYLLDDLYEFDEPDVACYFYRLFRAAVLLGRLEVVTFFLNKKIVEKLPELLRLTVRGKNVLHLAVERFVLLGQRNTQGDVTSAAHVVLVLIEAKVNPYEKDNSRQTPLYKLSPLTPTMGPGEPLTLHRQYAKIFIEALFLTYPQPRKPCDFGGEGLAWLVESWEDVADMKTCLQGHILNPGFRREYSFWDLCLGGDRLEDLGRWMSPQCIQDGLNLELIKLGVKERTPYFAHRFGLNLVRASNIMIQAANALLSEILAKGSAAETKNPMEDRDAHGLKVASEAPPITLTKTPSMFSEPGVDQGSGHVNRRIWSPALREGLIFFPTDPARPQSAPRGDLESSSVPPKKMARLS